jgi:hypothetical protein
MYRVRIVVCECVLFVCECVYACVFPRLCLIASMTYVTGRREVERVRFEGEGGRVQAENHYFFPFFLSFLAEAAFSSSADLWFASSASMTQLSC